MLFSPELCFTDCDHLGSLLDLLCAWIQFFSFQLFLLLGEGSRGPVQTRLRTQGVCHTERLLCHQHHHNTEKRGTAA